MRIYHGVWGTGLFQSIYSPAQSTLRSLLLMPEWVLATVVFGGLGMLGLLWSPLLIFLPIFLIGFLLYFMQAASNARRACPEMESQFGKRCFRKWAITTWLHLIQPIARLLGRIEYDLHPWSRRGVKGLSFPRVRKLSVWSEQWRSIPDWLGRLESQLRSYRVVVIRGGGFDRWDLEAWCGFLGGVRLVATVEEHGGGKQMVKVRSKPWFAWHALWMIPVFLVLSVLAALDGAWVVASILGILTLATLLKPLHESAAALKSVVHAVSGWETETVAEQSEE